jgi:hypothetical protein
MRSSWIWSRVGLNEPVVLRAPIETLGPRDGERLLFRRYVPEYQNRVLPDKFGELDEDRAGDGAEFELIGIVGVHHRDGGVAGDERERDGAGRRAAERRVAAIVAGAGHEAVRLVRVRGTGQELIDACRDHDLGDVPFEFESDMVHALEPRAAEPEQRDAREFAPERGNHGGKHGAWRGRAGQ